MGVVLRWASILALGAGLLTGQPATSAKGQSLCAGEPVSARGEPASYRWLALIKARGNWRSKVRMLPDLGSPYANWSRAAGAVERCIAAAGKIVCTVTATPCRPS